MNKKSSRGIQRDAKLTSRKDRQQNSHAAAGLCCRYYLLILIIRMTMAMTITMIMIMIMTTIMITVTGKI